jgi:hypothetical protein
LPNHIFGRFDVVVTWEAIHFGKELIDEASNLDKVGSCVSRDDDILNFKLQHLFRVS